MSRCFQIFETSSADKFNVKDDPEHPTNMVEPSSLLKSGRGLLHFAAWSQQDPALHIQRDFKEYRALVMLDNLIKVQEAGRELEKLFGEGDCKDEYYKTALRTGDKELDKKREAAMHKLRHVTKINGQ
jgi:hypothetical protein